MNFLAWCLGAILAVLLGAQAVAHHAESGWKYPAACCNKQDCRILHVENVIVTERGYFLPDFGDGGTTIPFYATNTSPDGEYHVCIRHYDHMDFPEVRELSQVPDRYLDRMNRSAVCFWTPEGGV